MQQYEHLVWTPDMVQNFWDYLSRDPEIYFAYRHGAEIVRQITPYLKTNGKVLDYGCGPGFLLQKLLEAGFHTAGLDTSKDTRQTVAEKFIGEKKFLGVFDQTELLKTDLRFDAITIIEVIEHLYDEQLDELLTVIKKLLNPGGRIIFTTPNEENLEKSYVLCPVTNKLFHRWQHVRSWSTDSLRQYLEVRKFAVNACFTTHFGISFHQEHSRHPVKDTLRTAKKKLKYALNPTKKQPHLVAIAEPS